jgi:hypothetical protein
MTINKVKRKFEKCSHSPEPLCSRLSVVSYTSDKLINSNGSGWKCIQKFNEEINEWWPETWFCWTTFTFPLPSFSPAADNSDDVKSSTRWIRGRVSKLLNNHYIAGTELYQQICHRTALLGSEWHFEVFEDNLDAVRQPFFRRPSQNW